ncbi:hypothetical protein [Staphylococcus phage vB_SepM_ phiIPLA-C1C]|uniref:Uncharacterized protein n=2 Tax=Sepunavirus TaxID=1980928 RepID=A0A0D3MVJ9_9CAUD|nr:hypothetical protein AVU40_gp191 [Staphylococcus phage phiIPLA-C1C]MDU7109319.1 hypothetical protein [Clostridium perfringens]QLF86787.1 hypothetical protein BESEP4_00053 [Staphylococcus phage vB_SepM_BE04]QLF87177.1 hypothetical protein BESEP6_00029 [Staphylococcus phage vB_SepM_BE06]QLF87520.1 hypothetical protein BESEP7_00172 [Staphylococcus phage vB_SepM_BE07]QLF87604.1 hypothetical protein BESEP8_00056 [Staphylococcus phage vB_SepM_BE08]QLF87793.1 hypothetical protein BESEP9_00045 [St
MSKLSKSILTNKKIEDLIDMVDSFELQQVRKVIGDDNFSNIITIVNSLDNDYSKVLLVGVLDKLLHSTPLVEYDDVYTTLRKYDEAELKEETANLIVQNTLYDNCTIIPEKELPNIGDLESVQNLIKVINVLSIIETPSTKDLFSVSEEFLSIKELMNNYDLNVEGIIDKLYNLDKNIEDKDSLPKDLEELIKYVIEY